MSRTVTSGELSRGETPPARHANRGEPKGMNKAAFELHYTGTGRVGAVPGGRKNPCYIRLADSELRFLEKAARDAGLHSRVHVTRIEGQGHGQLRRRTDAGWCCGPDR